MTLTMAMIGTVKMAPVLSHRALRVAKGPTAGESQQLLRNCTRTAPLGQSMPGFDC